MHLVEQFRLRVIFALLSPNIFILTIMTIRRYFSTATSSNSARGFPLPQSSTSELRSKVQEDGEYIDMVKKAIDTGSMKIFGDPIVKPSCPFALATELSHAREHPAPSVRPLWPEFERGCHRTGCRVAHGRRDSLPSAQGSKSY